MKNQKRKLKFKKQRVVKNSLLSEKLIYTGTSDLKTRLELIQYDEHTVDIHTIKSIEELAAKKKKDSICWLNIYGLTDEALIADIQNYFSLHLLEMQDILNNEHIPKIEDFKNNILLILKALSIDENNDVKKEQLSFVLSENFLLTFQETDIAYFDDIKNALHEKTIRTRKKSTGYLLSLLLRNICDTYTSLVDQVEDALEDLETNMMDLSSNQVDTGLQIQMFRNQYILLKKTIVPLKESFTYALNNDDDNTLNKLNSTYINDTLDHLLMAVQKIDTCREIISSLLDLYISNNDLRMNNIMKQLTMVGTIFIPLTFVVGVWGMNFSIMPELNWKYGYLFAWAIMILTGLVAWLYFRHKKWN